MCILKDIDFASDADDNASYIEHDDIDQIISRLEETAESLFKWFSDNQMKANADKCHLRLNNSCKTKIKIGKFENESSTQEKLLGITIDNNLNFVSHVENLCKNCSRKMHALVRISPYMSITKKRSLLNAFFISQFSYVLLIWMCHSRTLRTSFMKDVCVLLMMIKNQNFKNCLTRINLFQYTIDIYKSSQQKCMK